MREAERGPADPVHSFKRGLPVGHNKVSTGEGFLPVGLLGKGDEVAKRFGSSSTRKRGSGHRYCEETPSRASP